MEQIIEPNKITAEILGKQKYNNTCNYRLIKYQHSCDIDNGILIINFLTSEMIYLNEKEKAKLEKKELTDIKKQLISKWFFVPVDNDDLMLYKQLENTRSMIYSGSENKLADNIITTYTILPTTDCNARCFYCFELGRNRSMMTEETAGDIAEYIEKNCGGKPVRLRWFGGEPLYNVRIIDIICGKLRDKKIEYVSNMVTNGYLFDEQIIERAKSLWNLQNIQITLDGTEKIYNRVKAFIYKDVNPFLRVTDNIERLLAAGFNVHVRMNMDFHNEAELYDLVNYLHDRYSQFDNFTAYSHLLFEENGKQRTLEEKEKLVKEYIKLEKYMHDKGIFRYSVLTNTYKKATCMASKDNSVVVMTDGRLGKCEYYTDSNAWGSIYSEDIDYDMKNKYKVSRKYFPQCDDCAYRPFCFQKSACPHALKDCDEIDRLLTFKHFEEYMRVSYDNFRLGNTNKINIF